MKNKWIMTVLVASLAFNLAIVTTTLIGKQSASEEAVIERIAPQTRMNLTADQKSEISRIIKSFSLELAQFKQEVLKQRMNIIDELSDPACDFEKVKNLTDRLNHTENQLNQLFIEALVEINARLDSPQRLDFLLALSENWFFLNGADQ